jgi:proline iminopeptidase
MRNYTIIFLLFSIFIFACKEKKIPDEGFIKVEGGKIWYKTVGANKKKTPILLLHGGPGHPGYYLSPLEKLATDRPVIFYDQLGCGRSEKPNDTSLWKLSRLVKEIETIRKELHLNEIHLFGHSCGGTLAAEYMATNPSGIKSIIFASPVISVKMFLEDENKLLHQLPISIRDTILLHEKNGMINSQAYQNAALEYYKRYYCRIFPYPKEVDETLKNIGAQLTETMWGNLQFGCTGNLKNFDRTSILKEIKAPTLFTCGRYDFTTPETTKWFADQVKNSGFVVFEKSAHMTMNEEPEAYINVVKQFLDKNEQ